MPAPLSSLPRETRDWMLDMALDIARFLRRAGWQPFPTGRAKAMVMAASAWYLRFGALPTPDDLTTFAPVIDGALAYISKAEPELVSA